MLIVFAVVVEPQALVAVKVIFCEAFKTLNATLIGEELFEKEGLLFAPKFQVYCFTKLVVAPIENKIEESLQTMDGEKFITGASGFAG